MTFTRLRVNVNIQEAICMIDYYTVTQFAKLTGKDPGNIRRMLNNGSLVGEKIGNQWVISKDTVYPSDRRVKSGIYRNWRNRKNVNQLSPKLINTLVKMSNSIANVYASELDSIVLYGSYARNEATVDSDIDIAVILYDDSDPNKHDSLIDITLDYELNLGITLSVVTVDFNQYKDWKNSLPFFKNIEKEGIVLWKTRKENYLNTDMKPV